ncbi:hypothetical protein [Desulfomonile tiedjei]|uniref:hypothetical protein n=1 Tax=Desulfomonile tiedjei TaxID=2358 RepID=UPI000694925B|nr:hypothetical protein [Desulfomonile tiedjei]
MIRLRVPAILFAALVLCIKPDCAEAFQSHPAPEGLYVHQIAHIVFIIAMGFLAYWLQYNLLIRERGWRLIQLACLLLILWNVVAFIGHWVETRIPDASVVGEPDWSQRIRVDLHPLIPLYYMLKLDHLVSVPAMIALFLGIRSLYKQALAEEHHFDE